MNINTQFDEIATYLHDRMVGMTEPAQRVYLHDLLAENNRKLNALFVLYGVPWDMIGQIRNVAYRQHFAGLDAPALAKQYQVPRAKLTDFMNAEALEGCVIRAMQTENTMGRGKVRTPKAALDIHRNIAAALRLYLIDNGYARPETLLPAGESVESVRKRLAHGGDLFNLSGLDDDDDEPQEVC